MDYQEKEFSKYLSRLDVWAISLSCIIGWGAFVMPGTTFLPVAGPLGTAIAFIISALVMGVIGLNYSYLMTEHPGIGGVYAYTKKEFGRGHAFLSAWFLCLSYLALIPQNATALAVMFRALFGDAVEQGLHYTIAGYDMYLREAAIAVAVLLVIGILAAYFKPFLQYLLTVLAVIFLSGVVALFCIVMIKVPVTQIASAPAFGSTNPIIAVLSIIILSPWAFVGFEVISLETAHFKFPVKKSRSLIGIAIALGGFIYIAMSVVAVSVVPDGYGSWQEYIKNLGEFDGYAALPTFYAAEELLGKPGLVLIGVTATAAVLSTVIGFYRACGRILENMSDDNVLDKYFSKPKHCYLFLMGMSVVIALIGRNALGWVVDLSSLGAIVSFGYASFVVLKTAKRKSDKRYIIFGKIGIAASFLFAVAQLMPRISAIETMKAESYFLLSLWCLLGFAFYYRTMLVGGMHDKNSETITISSMFILAFYGALVWYIKKLVSRADQGLTASLIIKYSIAFGVLVLTALLIMLLIAAQLKKRQDESEKERIRAVESSNAKSRFLFNMSHDIRTPMNAIIGYTDLAKQEEMSDTARDYLKKIEISGQHLLALINDILEMSRIESGRLELENEPCDICKLAVELYDIFSLQMEQKKLGFSIYTDEVKHRYVNCDRQKLNRVLMNLVSNAYKFTPEGGTVTVSVTEEQFVENETVSYLFVVKDTGIGMSKEFSEKMFTAFERERTSTESKIEGTGLGLAIAKNIIDLMGGTIKVDTAPNQGTQITVRIGFEPAQEGDLPVESAVSEEKHNDLSGKRLLVVEDNEINKKIAVIILTKQGFEVETAENGQIAVDMVSSSEPGYYDLILMDIQMPVMNGYDAAKAIRALDNKALSNIPIVAMTANALKEDRQTAEDAGMQGHIAKPINVEVMMSTIERALNRN